MTQQQTDVGQEMATLGIFAARRIDGRRDGYLFADPIRGQLTETKSLSEAVLGRIEAGGFEATGLVAQTKEAVPVTESELAEFGVRSGPYGWVFRGLYKDDRYSWREVYEAKGFLARSLGEALALRLEEAKEERRIKKNPGVLIENRLWA